MSSHIKPNGMMSPVTEIGESRPDPTRVSLSGALRWAWTRWRTSAGVFAGATALWAAGLLVTGVGVSWVISAIVQVAFNLMSIAPDESFDEGSTYWAVAGYAVYLAWMALLAVAASCWLRPAVAIADGQRPELGDFFRPLAAGSVLLVALVFVVVYSVIDVIVASYLDAPWLATILEVIIVYLFAWAPLAAVDRPQPSAIAGLHEGAVLALARPGATFLTALVWAVSIALGAAAILVGLLVTVPLATLTTIYLYRAFSGHPLTGTDDVTQP